MQLTVVTLSGKRIQLYIDSDAKVLEMKEELFHRTDVSVDVQHILHRGKLLRNSRTLEDYKIEEGETLYMVLSEAYG
jgi:hypothetical protein